LKLTDTKSIYYLFEESQNDPTKDPVIMWSNGGPGCSSLIGWLGEIGPWIQQNDGSFMSNPYAWNKNASVLYFDHPAPVGFSYCSGSECYANDTSDAVDNLAALQAWFAKFPEFKTNDFWLSGESYAGVY
jgi:carboxypeptidase C (cathepsin A)